MVYYRERGVKQILLFPKVLLGVILYSTVWVYINLSFIVLTPMIPAKQQSRLLEEHFDQVPYLYPCAAMESHGTTRAGNLNQTLIQNSRCSYIMVLKSQELYVIYGDRGNTTVEKLVPKVFIHTLIRLITI